MGEFSLGNSKPLVLVYFDDTIFPLAFSYSEWLSNNYDPDFNMLSCLVETGEYKFHPHIVSGDHYLLLERFIQDEDTLNVEPLFEARAILEELAGLFSFVCCTNRYRAGEAAGTEAWLRRYYGDIISDVLYAREDTCNMYPVPKSVFVQGMNAVALIDEVALNMVGLPSEVLGLVVKRVAPLPSDEGAVGWVDIRENLLSLL